MLFKFGIFKSVFVFNIKGMRMWIRSKKNCFFAFFYSIVLLTVSHELYLMEDVKKFSLDNFISLLIKNESEKSVLKKVGPIPASMDILCSLYRAARYGRTKQLMDLVPLIAKLNVNDIIQQKALQIAIHLAAIHGHETIVSFLLQFVRPLTETISDSLSLYDGVTVSIVVSLLPYMNNVNKQFISCKNNSLLHLAILKKRIDIAELLFSQSALDIDQKNIKSKL